MVRDNERKVIGLNYFLFKMRWAMSRAEPKLSHESELFCATLRYPHFLQIKTVYAAQEDSHKTNEIERENWV
jgi:hypothetical protein